MKAAKHVQRAVHGDDPAGALRSPCPGARDEQAGTGAGHGARTCCCLGEAWSGVKGDPLKRPLLCATGRGGGLWSSILPPVASQRPHPEGTALPPLPTPHTTCRETAPSSAQMTQCLELLRLQRSPHSGRRACWVGIILHPKSAASHLNGVTPSASENRLQGQPHSLRGPLPAEPPPPTSSMAPAPLPFHGWAERPCESPWQAHALPFHSVAT